ncbi:MAG: carboxypeptidase-like regulatory domain-containing protein [Lentimicrobium sp.]|jgi:hypothetical protein|nr:carboxypeptidase-like regulatory domain-containing protein [Lentimicrobium sp.]MCO5257179.1 carboxypeptidase-like regulatory domain-containing protein [Lentimicrobium sp.]HOP13153.1 carboxypeptidase-like regulatory domain-containing protein [Lentimicrobium sp.]HPF64047.1 carboxypeptidase-like regulatory domain-containing protein [Lentimicrobium sp.]HPR25155.1 carboxypeptidase-like regulatory domain-containing protein [Lentimicrobium sp.]
MAQVQESDLVQFSGVVVAGDSIRAVPFVNIRIKGSNRGTTSDLYGFFSLVARKGDVIQFSAVGFKKGSYRIPDTLSASRYSLVQIMTNDTILLKETVIYPWPTPEQFKQAFVWNKIPDDDLTIARKNLDKMEMRERALAMPMDGSMNYRNYMDNQVSKLYYRGQAQPIPLFNPFAWAEFIKAWKRGDFKRKE